MWEQCHTAQSDIYDALFWLRLQAALASGDVCYSSGGVGVDRKYDCPTGTKCGANNDDGYNSDLTCDVPSTNFCKDPNAFLKGNWCVSRFVPQAEPQQYFYDTKT